MLDNPQTRFHDTLNGFLRSRVLVAGHRLNLFRLLAHEALPREQALHRLDLPERAGNILINACLALGLITETSGALTCPPEMARVLVRDPDDAFHFSSYMIEYYDVLYRDLADIEEIIRTDGRSSNFRLRDYFKEDVSQVDAGLAADYSAYMDATMAKIVSVVAEMYDFSQHAHVLDLCGGPGTFCRELLARYPALRATLLEIPAVAEIARKKLQDADLGGRMQVLGGDAFSEAFPANLDCITMCRSAHDWGDPKLKQLFARCHEALAPGGKLLVIERMIPDEFDERATALYLRAVYFLAKSDSATYRSPGQYHSMLRDAGFRDTHTLESARDPYEFFQGLHVVVAEK